MRPSDRRLAYRFPLKVPLRVRVWKSSAPEENLESMNLSERGVYFATDTPLREGVTVQIRFEMPEKITGRPAAEWYCTGRVVRVERISPLRPTLCVAVRFDYYEESPALELHDTKFFAGKSPMVGGV
jgi:hypothetical protein